MNRRITQKRKLALDRLAKTFRDLAEGDVRYVSANMQMVRGAQAAGVRRYAMNWLLATGELPTCIHEVPWGLNPPHRNSIEVDYDRLHVPPSVPVSEPAR